MALFKCKMCGGALEIEEGKSVAICGYCGTKQTLPKLDDDKRANLYDRANHFRRNNEFDKAENIYEKILNEDSSDSEAYWSLVLCRYGIEYVEDPKTHKRIPTVNRTQFTSIFDDDNYKSALKYADAFQKKVYEDEANAINSIQKNILEISQKEEPFDIFICYKETDNHGKRTPDSVLATELYHELVKEGFKVFFSRITLEDKLGTAYEPYIFAALNSAKVMVVLGTRQEYFNAVWVKNEWSRYLSLIRNGAKKILIPAYRDMDPYDLPEEFSHLQAQDMSKLGFMQDLVRGIQKIVNTSKEETTAKVVVEPASQPSANVNSLIERAFLFLEDKKWQSADEYCEKVLDIEPKNALGYLGKLMAELHVDKRENLKNCAQPFDYSDNYQKIIRFGNDKLKKTLEKDVQFIKDRNEHARLQSIYNKALHIMNSEESTEEDLIHASKLFDSIKDFEDSAELSKKCLEKAENSRKDSVIEEAKKYMLKKNITDFEYAITSLKTISGYKNSDELIAECMQNIEKIEAENEKKRLERERQKEIERIEAEKRKKKFKIISITITSVIAVLVTFIILFNTVIIPRRYYNQAVAALNNGNKAEAAILFGKAKNHKDAAEKSFEIWDEIANRETFSAGYDHTVGLKKDGSVVAVGNNENGQCDVENWSDIVAVATGCYHTVGLKKDGTVEAVGKAVDWQCYVYNWTDIVAVSAGYNHTVGLKKDGTMVAVGNNAHGRCDVDDWSDIVAVSANSHYTVGLKKDGTVVAVGSNDDGKCDVEGWTDIVAISAGGNHTIGLKKDGTVVATKYDGTYNYYDGQCDVDDWSDIVAVSAGYEHTVGLKKDGTVVAVGNNEDGQCNVENWSDIVAVSAGSSHTVGLKKDGTVVAVGYNNNGQCDVEDWKDIKTPNR